MLALLVTSMIVAGLLAPVSKGEQTLLPPRILSGAFNIELQCVIKEDCVFAATEPADRFSTLEKERWLDTERSKEDPCEGQEKSSNCCTAASRDPDFVRGFNRRIREQSEDVARICKLLCTQGRDSTCYLSCDLSSWLFLCAKPTSTSPKPTADSDDDSDDDDDSTTTPSSQSLTDDDEEGPNVTVIVVSCLAAFLAGITGAILITWFLRRRKGTKERGGEAPSDNTSTTAVSGQHTVYEELPEGTLYQKQSVKSSRPERISSENEYTYIPDHQTASRTTSSSYNVPGDHLANRKLPSAPAQPHGTGNGSGPRRAEAGTRPENYSLAKEPGGASRKYFELEKNEEQAPANGQYFILEKQAREGTAGDDYYSALKRDGEGEEEEYSALDQEPADGAYTREYLELVPDYLLQKPVD